MITPRPYQQKTIDELYSWFQHNSGHPCINLPTGAGKSIVIAMLCRDALTSWPDTRILIVTHTKELIEQDANKIREYWPNAPMGIYSAAIGRRELEEPVTVAGIQSIIKQVDNIPHTDLLIVDEAHLISHKEEGSYRKLVTCLEDINPSLRVIGLTASPFRLGHGMITDKPAIFDDIIEPVTIEELQLKSYLSRLISKVPALHLDTKGVHKRGGEYIESELQKTVDTADQNRRVVDDIISHAGDRKHWLIFCTGVKHSQHIADVFLSRGIPAACLTGKTPKAEREKILEQFKAGEIKAVCNPNILTTGFDFPDIDLIAMLRPTMSPGLYLQQAGRGLRVKSHTDHCLVLDFAGVVELHGPVTNIQPPKKPGEGDGVPPSKICDACDSIVFAGCRTCPDCGHAFPPPEEKPLYLRQDDIQGDGAKCMQVGSWFWEKKISRTSGKEMLVCEYFGKAISDRPIKEYYTIFHPGFAGDKALSRFAEICKRSGVNINQQRVEDVIEDLNFRGDIPTEICYKKDGKFFRIIDKIWRVENETSRTGSDEAVQRAC